MKFLKTALAAAAFALVGAAAQAATYGFTHTSSGTYGQLSISLVAGTTSTYQVRLDNNSTGTSDLTGFVLSASPTGATVSPVNNDNFAGDIAGDTDFFIAGNTNTGGYVGAGSTTYEFCFIAGGSNSCPGAGSNNVAVQPGTSAVLQLTFSTAMTFDGAGLRFQNVPIVGSLKLANNCDPATQNCTPPQVPLPASLPLLLAGLGVTGYIARRKRAA